MRILSSLIVCAILFAGANAKAADAVSGDVLAAMGLSGMQSVSDADGMKVRGKGVGGVSLTPFVISYSNETVSQFAAAKTFSVNISVQKTAAVQSLHASKTEFLFIGPRLPSLGGYYK